MLEVFFFSWLWASLREFPRVSILSTKSQVINHFPEVSAKSSGRSGKVVVSLSLLHYEIVDNDEQKGDRDSLIGSTQLSKMNTQLTIFALAIFLFATCSRGKVIDFFYSIKARKRTFFCTSC